MQMIVYLVPGVHSRIFSIGMAGYRIMYVFYRTACVQAIEFCSVRKEYYERGNYVAYRREANHGADPMIKSVALLEYPPKQVFRLIMDTSKRSLVEANVRNCERVDVLNSHTFLDYYAFDAIWPTAAREFAVAMHWQVLGRGRERAICIVGFTCLESEACKAIQPSHVRGRLVISMYLLRPVGDNQCHFTRLLSFDPNVPTRPLARKVVEQQARLPAALAEYLSRHEPDVPTRLLGEISDEVIVRDVIDRFQRQRTNVPMANNNNTTEQINNLSNGESRFSYDDDVATKDEETRTGVGHYEAPGIMHQMAILFVPIALHRVAAFFNLQCTLHLFGISIFVAVRQLSLLHLGVRATARKHNMIETGPITTRFQVDLKGVLRFIANKKEEREELNRGIADVSVVHLVAAAVSTALQQEPALRMRRRRIPALLIDELIDRSSEPMSVSVLSGNNPAGLVCVQNVDGLSIQDIADIMSTLEADESLIGECLVLAAPNFETTNMQVESKLRHPHVSVVAVVGGVHVDRFPKSMNKKPRPMISISLSIDTTSFAIGTQYAEEVQKLLQFPEMCDV